MHLPPQYISISSLNLYLSNQIVTFEYKDYFIGFMDNFYIVSYKNMDYNIVEFDYDNKIALITNISVVSNYNEIVVGTSNIFGNIQFTFNVVNYGSFLIHYTFDDGNLQNIIYDGLDIPLVISGNSPLLISPGPTGGTYADFEEINTGGYYTTVNNVFPDNIQKITIAEPLL